VGFATLWKKTRQGIVPGGHLAGQLFGNRDECLRGLEKGDPFEQVRLDPRFEPIRKDPRFPGLLKKLNLA
jgi:hypothetical protein